MAKRFEPHEIPPRFGIAGGDYDQPPGPLDNRGFPVPRLRIVIAGILAKIDTLTLRWIERFCGPARRKYALQLLRQIARALHRVHRQRNRKIICRRSEEHTSELQ